MALFLYACEFNIKVFFAPCVSVAKKIADTSTGFLQNLYLLFLGFYRHALTAPETVFLGALVVSRYRLCLDRDLRRTPLLSPAAESTSCVLFRNMSHSGEYIGV